MSTSLFLFSRHVNCGADCIAPLLENCVQTISSHKTHGQQFWSRHRVPTHEITYRTPHEAEAGVAVAAVVEVEREVVVLVWISTRLEPCHSCTLLPVIHHPLYGHPFSLSSSVVITRSLLAAVLFFPSVFANVSSAHLACVRPASPLICLCQRCNT